MISSWIIQMGPKSNDKCPQKRQKRRTDRKRRRLCENRGRVWSYAEVSQGRPGAIRSWQRQGKILPYSLQRERGPANTLISNFWPERSDRINIYCFKPPTLWKFVTIALGNEYRQFVMKMQHLKGKHMLHNKGFCQGDTKSLRSQRHFSFRTLTYRSPSKERAPVMS